MTWNCGDVVVRREISWGRPCLAIPVRVIEDSDSLLATFIPESTPLSYADCPDVVWPTESGRHPWWPTAQWQGHGVLMLQRPGEPYAVWHFWAGPERRFESWYLNLQEPFRRSAIGYDTQDHELDVIVLEDLQWFFKDDEKLDVSYERLASEPIDQLHIFREPSRAFDWRPVPNAPHWCIRRGAARADTDIEPSSARMIDGLRLLCEQRRMTRSDRRDQQSDPHAFRRQRQSHE
jgi:hypothetical protein